jgi:carbon monoxide dehydrogenase subunit G
MIEVSESVEVEAPVSTVFAFMDDPANHVIVTPSLGAVENVEYRPDGSKRLDYTFSMAGVDLEGVLDEVERDEHRRMLFEMRGQLTGQIELEFEETEPGTRLTYTGRYDLPGRVLGAVARPFVRKYNQRELSTTLANVRTHVESDAE